MIHVCIHDDVLLKCHVFVLEIKDESQLKPKLLCWIRHYSMPLEYSFSPKKTAMH